jgi:hypothetical protein
VGRRFKDDQGREWVAEGVCVPLEGLNRGLARRCDVVGIFPHTAVGPALSGVPLKEVEDEWLPGAAGLQPGVHAQTAAVASRGDDAGGAREGVR